MLREYDSITMLADFLAIDQIDHSKIKRKKIILTTFIYIDKKEKIILCTLTNKLINFPLK